MQFDTIITGGTVVDGRIAAIEADLTVAAVDAGEVIDAKGRIVTPGFVDVGTQLAHGQLRRYVMGPTAGLDAAASSDEIRLMGRLAREAIEAGAFGFTNSRTLGHKALDGTPVPGTQPTAAGLARSDNPTAVAEEFEWVGRLAGDTGVNTTFILLQNHADPERWRRPGRLVRS